MKMNTNPPVKRLLVAANVLALALGVASASETINFATGQNAAGNIQFTGDALDAHWTLTSGGNDPLSRPNLYVVVPGQSDSGFPSWINNGPNSSWIAPNPDNAYGNGDYVISYSFDLTGYDLTTAQFTGGEWTIDDEGYIQLNGTTIASLGDGNWGSLLSFNIPTSDLVAGVNTLTITSINSDSYIEGVRLEGTLTVAPAPPSITSQPLSQSVFQGGDAVFQVIASGSAPLGYQWWYNQTNILAGQTNATLSLSQATSAMSGSYSVVITNTIGSITSQPAVLTVYPFAYWPTSARGWYDAGYTTDGVYTIAPGGPGGQAAFSVNCIMSLAGGGWTALTATVANSLINTPANESREYLYVQNGTSRYYRTQDTTLVWSWSSGQDLYGTYYYSTGGGESTFQVTPSGEHQLYGVGGSSGGGPTFKCLIAYTSCKDSANAQVQLCQDRPGIFGGACQCGVTVYIRENTISPLPSVPSIVAQPTNQTVIVGNTAQFSVGASGSQPLFYQWVFNGTNLTDNAQITGSRSSNALNE